MSGVAGAGFPGGGAGVPAAIAIPANPYAAPVAASGPPATGRVLLGWSVFGHRIELRAGMVGQRLAVDGREAGKVGSKGDTQVQIDGRPFTLRREAGLMGSKSTLLSPTGQMIPNAPTHVVALAAVEGTACVTHPSELAVISCARCMRLCCASCVTHDGTHCPKCFEQLLAQTKQSQADMALAIPAFVFMIGGGALGGALGGAAAGLSIAAAKKLKSTATKWLVAIGLYILAAIIYVVVAGALHGSLRR